MVAKSGRLYLFWGGYIRNTNTVFPIFPCAAPLSSLILMCFSWKMYLFLTHLGKQLNQRPRSPVKSNCWAHSNSQTSWVLYKAFDSRDWMIKCSRTFGNAQFFYTLRHKVRIETPLRRLQTGTGLWHISETWTGVKGSPMGSMVHLHRDQYSFPFGHDQSESHQVHFSLLSLHLVSLLALHDVLCFDRDASSLFLTMQRGTGKSFSELAIFSLIFWV